METNGKVSIKENKKNNARDILRKREINPRKNLKINEL
jgi:hypothetical protein